MKINLRYRDLQTTRMIRKMQKLPAISGIKENLSGYISHKVNWDALQKDNILIICDPIRNNVSCATKETNAYENQIIFSHNKRMISTSATYCLSLILFCKNMKVAAAIHISADNTLSPIDVADIRDMFLLGYANLRSLVKDKPISAFICGGCVVYDSDERLKGNRDTLSFLLPELVNRGITIKRLDIGDYYRRQELYLQSGIYRVILSKDEGV